MGGAKEGSYLDKKPQQLSRNRKEFEGMKTIMVADDSKDLVTVLRGILEGGGYEVLCAYNGEEVFSRLEEKKPDLIILDIMMPKMDGLEVLSKLKSGSDSSSIPVILLTAKGQYKDVLTGYQLGSDYYISKPFTNVQLMNGVNLLLGTAN